VESRSHSPHTLPHRSSGFRLLQTSSHLHPGQWHWHSQTGASFVFLPNVRASCAGLRRHWRPTRLKVVEKIGGRVGSESEPGKGSCFRGQLRAVQPLNSAGFEQSLSAVSNGLDSVHSRS
jgi:hypothetical protein